MQTHTHIRSVGRCDAVLAARRELIGGLAEHRRSPRAVAALLGYDFMLSADGAPYLIEVRTPTAYMHACMHAGRPTHAPGR